MTSKWSTFPKQYSDTTFKILNGIDLKYSLNDLRNVHQVFKLSNNKAIETEIKKRIEVRLISTSQNALVDELLTETVGTFANENDVVEESTALTAGTPITEDIFFLFLMSIELYVQMK